MGDITKGTTLSPMRNFLSQTTSFVTSEVATYLASLVESIMQAYFTLLQLIVAQPRVSTKLEIDLRESLLD